MSQTVALQDADQAKPGTKTESAKDHTIVSFSETLDPATRTTKSYKLCDCFDHSGTGSSMEAVRASDP